MTLAEIIFNVKGSSPEPYEIRFIKDGDSLTALCSCPAGQYGNFCKHRIAILDGVYTAIVSDNREQATMIADWLAGTDVEQALQEFRNSENTADKKAIAAAKRKLARAMNS